MKIEYTLDGNDYLSNYLFAATRSSRIKEQRRRGRWLIPIAYTVFALGVLALGKLTMSVIFLLLAIFWAAFYPMYSRRHYVKHYKRFIAEQYRSRTEKVATVEINGDHIIAKDNGSESKIATTEIQEINEIPNLILIKLGPQSLIIPKYKIADADDVVKELKNIATELLIAYNEEPNWRWQ